MSLDKALKRFTDDGDLKRLNSAEETFLAYLVGEELAVSANNDIGNITLSSSGNTPIGSFVDFFYNQPVGTHPATSITSSETTTTLYQVAGIADESSPLFHKPVGYKDNDPTEGIYEMSDASFNTMMDRVNSKLADNDYGGAFYLGSTAPSANWSVYIAGAFNDTTTSGVQTVYNIYRKTTSVAPTGILDSNLAASTLMKIRRDASI